MSRALPWLAGALAFAAVTTLLIVQQGAATWGLRLGDSDNFMRLQEVRDWLGGQSWWDIRQHRADPLSGGLYTHWSRLADLPLAGAILLFRPIADADVAEKLALVVQPLVLLAAALALQARIAVTQGGRAAALPAVVVGALATPMLVQFVPGRVDHHGLQIVLVLAAIAALTNAKDWRGGTLAAAACALSLNVGLETLPYLAVVGAFVALRWAMRGDMVRGVTLGFAAGIAVAVPLLFAATIPLADWGLPKGDAIGRGHVALSALGGLGLAALAAVRPALRARWLGVAALGIAALVLVRLAVPEVAAEPYRTVGPLLWRLWISNIVETRSIFAIAARDPAAALGSSLFLVVTFGIALVHWYRARRDAAALLAALALSALVLASWQTRALALATAVAVPVAGGLLGRLWAQYKAGGSLLPFALAFVVVGHIPYGLLNSRPAATGVAPDAAACNTPAALAALATLPPGLILAPIDMGGSLLALTPHRVLATPIHRDVAGNNLAYRVLLAPPDAARALLADSGVRYLAYCPGDAETRLLTRAAPDDLLAGLSRGDLPDWLAPVGVGSPGPRVFRVATPPSIVARQARFRAIR